MRESLRSVLKIRDELPPEEFKQPIFITGCMRSGTTLLLNLLHEHPHLLKAGVELNNIWSTIGGAPCGINNLGPTAYRGASDADPVYIQNMTSYFTRYLLEAQSLRQHLIRMHYKFKFGTGGIWKDWSQVRLINKSIHLVNKVSYLHALFPGSKIIFIIRDIYGQSASQKSHFQHEYQNHGRVPILPTDSKQYFTRKYQNSLTDDDKRRSALTHFRKIPEAWLRMNTLAMQELDQLPDDQYYILSFKSLLENRSSLLNDLFEFLDVPQIHTTSIAQKNRKLMNTHTPGNPLEKWKKTLSGKEIEQIDNIIREYHEQYDAICEKLGNA